MKIGLDVHGVIDKYPTFVAQYTLNKINSGNEIHIITGQEREFVEPLVKSLGVPFTHFFSVVDYHKSIDTKMWQDDKKTWWMEPEAWLRTKGDYCKREGIEIHFDDSMEYGEFMPDTCAFVHLPRNCKRSQEFFLNKI